MPIGPRPAQRWPSGDPATGRHPPRPAGCVLGLPRGGIPVAGRVAAALAAPLDVLLVRKVGLPSRPELAMGAIAAIGDSCGGAQRAGATTVPSLARRARRGLPIELDTLCKQAVRYRGDRQSPELVDRLVVVVDDGLATGATMRAAIAALRRGADRLVLAVPIGRRKPARHWPARWKRWSARGSRRTSFR